MGDRGGRLELSVAFPLHVALTGVDLGEEHPRAAADADVLIPGSVKQRFWLAPLSGWATTRVAPGLLQLTGRIVGAG